MKSLTALIVLLVNLTVCAFVGSQCRGESILFDGFDGPALDPAWSVGPGFGGVSLTANPGNLRYTVPSGQGDGLYRPFTGTQWTLDSKIAYEMPFSNGRQISLQVIFGDLNQKGVNGATWQRDADQACGSCSRNRVIGSFVDGGEAGSGPATPPFLGTAQK